MAILRVDNNAAYDWWNCDDPIEMSKRAHAHLSKILDDRHSAGRDEDLLVHMHMYSPLRHYGISTSRYGAYYKPRKAFSKLNVVKPIIDTITSRVCARIPGVVITTDGGDYMQQTQASNLSDLVDFILKEHGGLKNASQIGRDALITGNSAWQVIETHDDVYIERILPGELYWDSLESLHKDPNTLYKCRVLSKADALELFSKHTDLHDDWKRAIQEGSYIQRANIYDGYVKGREAVTIVESFHRGAEKGNHLISTSAGPITIRDLPDNEIPIIQWHWSTPMAGGHGIGICEDAEGYQAEINRTIEKISYSMNMSAGGVWLKNAATKISPNAFSNKPQHVMKYQGIPPQFQQIPGLEPSQLNYLQFLVDKLFDAVGLSAMAATAEVNKSLSSGIAIARAENTQSARYLDQSQRWRDAWIKTGKLIISACKRLDERGNGTWRIKSSDKHQPLKEIKWKNVNLDESRYTIEAEGINLFANTPAAEIELLTSLLQAGVPIAPERFASTLANMTGADVKSLVDSAGNTDAYDLIFIKMTRDNEYTPPLLHETLPQGIQIASTYLLDAYSRGQDKAQSMLARWIKEATDMMSEAQVKAQLGGNPATSSVESALEGLESNQAPMTPEEEMMAAQAMSGATGGVLPPGQQ